MPDSIKLRPLPLIVTLLLVIVGFFIGRYSVGETESLQSAANDTNRPTKRVLTALEKPKIEIPAPDKSDAPSVGQSASDRTELSEREEQSLKTASEYIADVADQMGDLDELESVIGKWVQSDPESAIEWLAQGDRRDDILRVLLYAWASMSPEDSAAWLESNKGTEEYSSAVLGHALGIAQGEGFGEALDWLDSINDPLARTQIWSVAGEGAYDEDPDGTLERLAESGLPEDLQLAMVEEWNQISRNKSKRNAQNLASVYASAVAAGADFRGQSSAELARELVAGITGADSFSNTNFQIPNMSDIEIEKALDNLEFRPAQGQGEAQLNYNPSE